MNEKFDPCFQEAGLSQPNKFFKENKILIRPNVISEFFNYFDDLEEEKQITTLDILLDIVPSISHNSTVLVSKSINKLNTKTQDLMDVLIQLAIRLTGQRNQKVVDKLIHFIVMLAKENNLRKSNLQSVYSLLIADFYNQKLEYTKLCTAIEIMQKIFQIQKPTSHSPCSYFYFQGKDTQLSLNSSNTPPLWKFESGISLCLWFYLEKLKYSVEESSTVPQQKLFTIHTSVEGKGGGIEAYFVNYQLFYRILPEQYTEPTPKSNGCSLGQFQPNQWHFIGIDHEGPKTFGRSSTIKVVVNNNESFSSNMDFPRIPANTPIKKFCFGEHLVGKISSIMIFNQPIGPSQIQQLPKYYQYGFQNSHSLKSLDITFEKSISKIYLLLTPIRSNNNKCFDAINNNNGVLSDKIGVYYKDPLKFRMNELGGLQGILPFFYILRFCKRQGDTNAVNELLKLLIILLHERHDFQTQAAKIELLKVISNLLSDLSELYIDRVTLAHLKELKHVIQEPQLLQSFFIDFLWNLDLLLIMESSEVKSQYIAFLKSVYEQNPDHYNKLFSISQIISQAILKCDVRTTQCCSNHSLTLFGLQQKPIDQLANQRNIPQNTPPLTTINAQEESYNQISKIIQPLFEIVESIFLKSGDDLTQDLVQLLNAFNLKCSPCLHLSLFGTLKKILIDRPQEHQNIVKKYLKIIVENKGVYTFLYLMQNSPFIDIKSMCMKMISLLNQKTSKQQLINEYELCSYISSVLWSLNIGKNLSITPLISPQMSPEKNKQIPNKFIMNLDTEFINSQALDTAMKVEQAPIQNTIQFSQKANKKLILNEEQYDNSNFDPMNQFMKRKDENIEQRDDIILQNEVAIQQNELSQKQNEDILNKAGPKRSLQKNLKQFQLNMGGALNLNMIEDTNSSNAEVIKQSINNPENGFHQQEEVGVNKEVQVIAKPTMKSKRKQLQLDDDVILNTNDGFANANDAIGSFAIQRPTQQEQNNNTKKNSLKDYAKKLQIAQEENQERDNINDLPFLPPTNNQFGSIGSKKSSLQNNFIDSCPENDGFTFNPPSEPYDQMKVANNPGFNQAPSMLNKRAHGKFSFPVADPPNPAPTGMMSNGLDSSNKNRGGNSNRFQFESSGIPSGAGNYMEPKMSSKAGQALTFTFPNSKPKGQQVVSSLPQIQNYDQPSDMINIPLPKKNIKSNIKSLSLKQIDDNNDEEEDEIEQIDEYKLDKFAPLEVFNEQNNGKSKPPQFKRKPNLFIINDENKGDAINPPPPPQKPANRGPPASLKKRLEINIETVNEQYQIGGGETAIKQQTKVDPHAEEQEIAKLAKDIVLFMQGDLKYDFYESRMPNITQQQFNEPMSVRGIKNIDLTQTGQTNLENTENPLKVIMENSVQENEMSFSMDFNKEQSIGPTPKNLQVLNKKLNNSSFKDDFLATDDLIKAQQYKDEIMNDEYLKQQNITQSDCYQSQMVQNNEQIDILEVSPTLEEIDQTINKKEIEERQRIFDNIDFEPLYISIMEWVLHRIPGNLDSQIIINDKDNITSNHVLQILMTFYQHCNNHLRPIIIQNLQLIVKWNIQNSNTLLKYTEFYYWLLDILLDQQILMFTQKDNKNAVSAVLWDSGIKIHAILMKTALLQDPEGYKKIQGMFIWLETKCSQAQNKEQKYTFNVSSKYLLRSLWQAILDALIEETQGNQIQQYNNSTFWNNIIQIVYYTQEIILSAHNFESSLPRISDHQKIYISMRNFGTIVDTQNDKNIPKNFQKQIEANNWLDRGIVNGIVTLLDNIWSEQKFEIASSKFYNNNNNKPVVANNQVIEESESVTIQKQVGNMLNFSKQEEFLKDFEILMAIPIPERGSLMKISNLLMTLYIDDIIRRREPKQVLKESLDKFERMVKYYIAVCENTREKRVLAQKESIQANILFCLNYLYIKYETATAAASQAEANERQEHEKVKFCIGKTIKNIFVFILLCVEHIHQQYGHFDNYPTMKSNIASFSASPMIPNLNMIIFDLFHTYLLMLSNTTSQSQNASNSAYECILNIKILKEHKNEYFLNLPELIFSNEWVFCFTDNPKMWEVINKYYNDVFKNTQRTIREANEESAKGTIRSFKMNEMNKEVINRSYNNLIFENTAKVLELEESTKYRELQIFEENTRSARNLWKKIWKRLRIYDGLWRPEVIQNQIDFPYDEFKFSYENRQTNPFQFLKMDKYEVRNRMKPFLKIKLVDPKYVNEYQTKLKQLRINQGQHSNLSANVKLTIVQNQINDSNIDSINQLQRLSSQELTVAKNNSSESSGNLAADSNLSSNQQFSSNFNINTSQSATPILLNNQINSTTSSSGNSYLFNLGKNISKNIAKTFKSILPFSKDASHASQGNKNSEIINKNLLINQEVQFTKKCQWIKTLTARNGFLSMTEDNLVQANEYESIEQKESHIAMTPHKIPDDRRLIKEWPLKQIKEVQTRRYILKRTAIEIFFLDGSCVLLNFPHNMPDCEEVSQKLVRNRKKRCPNIVYHNTLDPRKLIEKTNITVKWQNRQISNFEYLMHLNGLASRSYKDLTQYPVFPWVITDYKSKDIFTSIRDFNKSMGALGQKDRIEVYQERFSSIDPFQDIPPFHYGSHYSSPAIIFQFMLRIQPFTNGTKILQGNKFDIADRLFYSIEDSFRCATEDVSDVRELIPELFYLPELFLNLNKEDFGIRQTGERVDNVDIPQWAEKNPFKFVVLHRKALESEAVSLYINNWIDLIYGYKQTGKEAEKNLNVFYHLTYEQKVDLDQIKDESTRISTETQIINFGQTPYQLFLDKPHPQRLGKDTVFLGRIIADPQAEIKVFRPSNGKKKKSSVKDYKLVNFFNEMQEEAIISLKWINETRFVCLRRNGQITQFRWYNNPTHQAQQTAIPFQCGEDKKKEITLDRSKKSYLNIMDQSVNYLEYPCYFLKESKIIIIGGMWDGVIKLVYIDTDQLIDTYHMHNETVTYITADNKENFLITGSKSGEVIVWKINPEQKLTVRYVINDHKDRITQIKISKDLLVFATASEDSTINLYNLISGTFYRTFFHPNNLPIDNVLLGYQPLPCVIFFSNQDHTLYSYSINGQFLGKCSEDSQQITSSLILRDNNFSEIIAYGNERGDVTFRELPFLNLRKVYNVSVGSPVLSIVPSKDKRFLLCGCSDGYISVLTDPQTSKINLMKPNAVNSEQQKH